MTVVNKIYWFRVYNSIIYHLYFVLCLHHLNSRREIRLTFVPFFIDGWKLTTTVSPDLRRWPSGAGRQRNNLDLEEISASSRSLQLYPQLQANCSSIDEYIKTWYMHTIKYYSALKNKKSWLTSVAQLVRHSLTKWKVTGLIPSQGTFLGCLVGPWSGHVRRQSMDVSLLHQCLSHSLSPSFTLSLKISKKKILKKNRKSWHVLQHGRTWRREHCAKWDKPVFTEGQILHGSSLVLLKYAKIIETKWKGSCQGLGRAKERISV